jgi:hypothetical protein
MNTITTTTRGQKAAATRAANKAAKLALIAQVAAELDTTPEDADIKIETSQDRLEAAYDAQELANWNSGVATPEAPDTVEAIAVATGYTGPMLALRERLAAGAYSKAINGQPCCGDAIAIKLGTLTPAQVIRACIIAMNLPNNPYTHLNIGQQSMNLRNKLRGCMKRGEFGFGVVTEAVEQVEEESAAA